MLVNARTDGNPERNEYAGEADQTKGNAMGVETNLQHSRYEGVDSEKLVTCRKSNENSEKYCEISMSRANGSR